MKNNRVQVFFSKSFEKVRVIRSDDGDVSINAEDVVRGLGWTTITRGGTKALRWNRFISCCKEIGVKDDINKGDYINESLFYVIAMRARNSRAQEFMKWIVLDVFPSARKNSELKTLPQNISDEIKAIYCLDKRTMDIIKRLDEIEEAIDINCKKQQDIRKLVVAKVKILLGGKDSPAYKELSQKTYSSLERDYKKQLDVKSYEDTPIDKYEEGKAFIEKWEPDRLLELMIKGANAVLNSSLVEEQEL